MPENTTSYTNKTYINMISNNQISEPPTNWLNMEILERHSNEVMETSSQRRYYYLSTTCMYVDYRLRVLL